MICHFKKSLALASAVFAVLALQAGSASARPDGALRHLDCDIDQIARYDGGQWICSEDSSAATLCGSGEALTGDGVCESLALPQVTHPPKYVFLSSSFHNGRIKFSGNTDLNGIEAADAVCQDHAESSVLLPFGQYKAWLSDSSSSPNDSFFHSPGPYILVDGTLVAANYADLTSGSLAQPIDLNENGVQITPGQTFPNTWTNTDAGGNWIDSSPCDDWTSADIGSSAVVGNYTNTGSRWTDDTGLSCIDKIRLYCVQQ